MNSRNFTFYIVDVFTGHKYAGNQLAVFRDASILTDREMQQIAKEMNYSETTFILSEQPVDGGYPVRIFTPAEEVKFAGHPTLGTAYIIQKEIIGKPIVQVTLNLKIGQIPVTFVQQEPDTEMLWMKQKPPIFGPTYENRDLAEVLSIDPEDMDSRFPIQEVSTGLSAIIVPLKSLDAVKRCQINKEKYFSFVERTVGKAILVFSPETYDPHNQLNTRVFVDYFGVPEDPATGSANGGLAGYLINHRYFGSDSIELCVEQGHEIGRPSLLYLRAKQTTDQIEVEVGGQTVMVAKGQWL